jgi:NhaP-type Na+/H+ or K+/H+ antiporter
MIEFFWAALIGSVMGAAVGVCAILAARWRNTNWEDKD